MKKIILLPMLWLLFYAYPLSAKVIRVNNQEPTNVQQNTFNTLAEGYTNAVNGDTLYIESSPTGYGGLDISKRLIIIGSGFFHSENPNLSINLNKSTFNGNVRFLPGSQGSKIISIEFPTNQRGISINVSNIEISKCFFGGNGSTLAQFGFPIEVQQQGLENIIVSNCFFNSFGGDNSYIFYFSFSIRNLVFSNNIVERNLLIPNNSSGILTNNIFKGKVINLGANSELQIHNNVFLGTTTVILPSPLGSNLSHNIASSELFGTENNNQENISEGEIFVGGQSPDAKYLIKENGPADGTGRDGVDIGPFGGPKPYKLSGLPDIPNIYDFSTSGIATPDDKLPITIKVRAN